MKKFYLLIMILVMSGINAFSQTTLFTEDWETAAIGQTPPAGWSVDLVSGTNYTYFNAAGTNPTCTPFSGSRFVEFQSYNASAGTINRLKRTTPVSTMGYSVVTVDFEWLVDPGYTNTDNVMIQWSVDGTNWNSTTSFSRYGASQQWLSETVTLPAGAANIPALYVGLLFTSAYGNNCHLDLLHIKASAGPNIVYTALGNTSLTTARTLTTTMTAPVGMPTSGIGLPVLYWKKNTGSWVNVQGVSLAGNQYSFTFGAGVVIGDVVSYYIVAQDLNAIPNVNCSPSAGAAGLTANPPAATTPPTTPNSYSVIGALCGTYNVGAGQTYTTLTAALADLANKEVTCPVIFQLTDNTYTETLPLIVNPFTGASSTNTVTLRPAAGKTPVVSGSSASGVIVLMGCNYFIIDGSNSGGSDKSMTWENTNSAANTYTVGIFNNGTVGASNCTLKNCLVKASSQVTNATYAVILNFAGGGYNNIVINNNSIYSANVGMQFAGVAGNFATNGQITNNIFGSVVDAQAIQYSGVLLAYCDNTLVQGNEIMGALLGNANYGQSGLNLSTSCTNTKIKQNKIHDWYYNGTGGWGNYGLYFSTADATTPTEISNNLIYNIKGDGYSTTAGSSLDIYGIYFSTGGNVKLYHNNINLTGSVTSSTHANYSGCVGIASGCSAMDFRNNIFKNSLQPVSGAPASKTFAIINGGNVAMWSTIDYNDYFVNGIGPNIGYQGSARATLNNWRNATNQDLNSLSVDPAFVSATDLHATANGLRRQGLFLPAVPVDYDGTGRADPPEIGAYQYAPNPVVVTAAATGTGLTTATLNGTINARNANVTSGFEYGLTTAYGTAVAAVPALITGATVTAITAALSGLSPCTLYHYRATGVSGGLTVNGADLTFSTTNATPVATSVAATLITGTTATVNGTVNANNLSTAVSFDYGLTMAYGTTVAGVPTPVSGAAPTAVSAALTGLLPGATYHFRVNGANTCGTVNGGDLTFTTPAQAPTVVTDPATGVSITGATLNGTVTANGASTDVTFEYGTTIAYGTTIPGIPTPLNGNTATAVSATLTGLLVNTTYHYRVCGVNIVGGNCGNDMTFLTGCPIAGPAGPITGLGQACQGGSGYVYTVTIPNASGYVWTLPVGGTITAGANTNSITVAYAANSVAGYVFVYGTAACGNGAPSQLAIAMNPPAAPTLAGPASVCVNSTGNVYTTQAGFSNYLWTVSAGGTITAGGGVGDNTVTITWTTTGPKTVSVNYNSAAGCPALAPTVYNVTVNALPAPAITGPSPACSNFPGLVYLTQAGMTGYTWSISAGGTITAGAGTNSITVTWNTTGAQNVSVNYINASGCTAAAPVVYPVAVNSGAAPIITGSTTLCVNSGYYNYTTEPGMSAYTWTISPGGTINYGGGTNVITVSWLTSGAQWVKVNYTNPSGCTAPAPTQLNITVNPLPAATGSITGTAAVCGGATGIAYSVAAVTGATTYVWDLPAGATIATGANTNAVTVDFASNASSGNITVYANNLCGNGGASPSFAVTVNPIPTAPVVTNTGYIAESDAPAGNQWYFNGTLIPGATGQTYDATLSGTGYFWSVVTLNGCSSDTSNHKYIVVTGVDKHSSSAINIYPVPNEGQFHVSIATASAESFSISIYNSLGVKIYEETKVEVTATLNKVIDLRPIPNGVYTVIFDNGNGEIVKKIVVNK